MFLHIFFMQQYVVFLPYFDIVNLYNNSHYFYEVT